MQVVYKEKGTTNFSFGVVKNTQNNKETNFASNSNLVILMDLHDLKNVIRTIKNKTIWIGIPLNDIDFKNKINKVSSNGFDNPYITTLSPMYEKNYDIPVIAFTYTGNKNKKSILNNVYHILEQHKKDDSCSLYAQLSEKAINKLKSLPFEYEKETTGELFVSEVVFKEGKYVYIIDIHDKVVQGSDLNIDVDFLRYNYHSHPESAYKLYNVKKAWPSLTDYLGYLKLGERTIFHCVATIEGLYILSFGLYWGQHIRDIDIDFIKNNYDFPLYLSHTPKKYVNNVNKIKYKGYPIFHVIYKDWNKASEIFDVSFSRHANSCIISEVGMNRYNSIHKK